MLVRDMKQYSDSSVRYKGFSFFFFFFCKVDYRLKALDSRYERTPFERKLKNIYIRTRRELRD